MENEVHHLLIQLGGDDAHHLFQLVDDNDDNNLIRRDHTLAAVMKDRRDLRVIVRRRTTPDIMSLRTCTILSNNLKLLELAV